MNELLPLLTGEDLIEKRFITAQFSLYPLRQSSLSQTINLALDALEDFNLKTQPGSMSTVISGTQRAVWGGLQEPFQMQRARLKWLWWSRFRMHVRDYLTADIFI